MNIENILEAYIKDNVTEFKGEYPLSYEEIVQALKKAFMKGYETAQMLNSEQGAPVCDATEDDS